MKTNMNAQVEMLTQENVRLYEENMKLKLMLKTNDTKSNTEKSTSKKANTTRKNENKNTNNKKSEPNKKSNDNSKNNKSTESLSKFQQEREAKKAIVLAKRTEKVPVPEIAKAIGQSEPTVRNYIRELRVEGKLAK